MGVWVFIAAAPNSAVIAPITVSVAIDGALSTTTSEKRMMRNPPALMRPACSRAETGVGVSITSRSHPWVGNWADLRHAAATNIAAAA